jgi:hypothetical protein
VCTKQEILLEKVCIFFEFLRAHTRFHFSASKLSAIPNKFSGDCVSVITTDDNPRPLSIAAFDSCEPTEMATNVSWPACAHSKINNSHEATTTMHRTDRFDGLVEFRCLNLSKSFRLDEFKLMQSLLMLNFRLDNARARQCQTLHTLSLPHSPADGL